MSPYKLFKADNPDEYAEIIVPRNRKAISAVGALWAGIKSRRFFESRGKENFGISYPEKFRRNFRDFTLEIAWAIRPSDF